MNYTDLLQFNAPQLDAQIKILEGIRDTIKLANTRYIGYIDEKLVPNWTTDNGIVSVGKLKDFSERNIQDFITYLDLRINDLNDALQSVKGIEQA